MSMSDPIADVLTRVRNAQRAGHEAVDMYSSKVTNSILDILKKEGFIEGFQSVASENEHAKKIKVQLKYYKGSPVIQQIERVSKPGRRIYIQWKEISSTKNNMGVSILSTPKGIISDKDAKHLHVGGEYICRVW